MLASFIVLFVALVLACVFLSIGSNTALVLDQRTVLVARLQPFWYRYALISSETTSPNYHYQTDLFYNKCDRFEITDIPLSFNYSGSRTDFSSASSSVSLPTTAAGEYAYLLPGSRLEFRIQVIADILFRECTIELELYDNFNDFSNRSGHRAIFSRCIRQGDSSAADPITVVYDITSPGFYYPLLSLPPTARYQVSISGTRRAYSLGSSQVIETCSLISNRTFLQDKCEFLLLRDSIALLIEDYCIVANTSADTSSVPSLPPPFITLTVQTTANIFRNILYVLVLAPVPLYFPMCLLLWCCFRCLKVCRRKCYNKFVTREYSTSGGGGRVDLEQL